MSSDGPVEDTDDVVYGHSASTLYTVNPSSYAVTTIGDFAWPAGSFMEQMTDIALDKNGNMVGISFDAVYAIDKTTAKCTKLSNFAGGDFNGLSFIAADQSGSGTEVLVGADIAGNVYSINESSGMQTQLGSYGQGYSSSGDSVSVEGATYATVRLGGAAEDYLVKINGQTGAVTQTIGNTGVADIWGLGYWKQKLFGFTESSGLVVIDVSTGQATPLAGGNVAWFGAGVTTSAPTIQ